MAKEEIYTIPLWDAVRSDDECPFCHIEHQLESDLISFCLSDAYMDDDFRQITNKIGFCKDHYNKLYNSSNKLGLVLINQTYMDTMFKELQNATKNITVGKKSSSLFNKNASNNSSLDKLYQTLCHDCYICNRIDKTMDRYYNTFFYLYKKEKEFIDYLDSTKGFCMPHYIKLIQTGQKEASASTFKQFINQTRPLFEKNFNRVLEDMQWFVNKYDYRYKNEPWKEAKDAPLKSIQKINKTKLF